MRQANLAAPLADTMLASYTGLLQTYPFRMNALSAGCIGALGDVIAQRIEAAREGTALSLDRLDKARTTQMFGFCCTWLGAPQVLWFRYLARIFPDGIAMKLPKTLLVHLGLMAPTTNTLFFAYREKLRGPDETFFSRYATRMRREFPSTTAYSLSFWTPVQAVNFTYVPLHLRPLYLNGMMVVWTTYLSIAGHRRY